MNRRKLSLQEVQRNLKKVPFNALPGMRLHRVHDDGITLACSIRDELRNSAGIAHGGVAAALADASVGIAIHRHLGGKRPITTVEMKINYFQPAAKGRMFARSHLLRVGSTLCVGRVDLRDDNAQPVGAAMVTYIFMDARRRERTAAATEPVGGHRSRRIR